MVIVHVRTVQFIIKKTITTNQSLVKPYHSYSDCSMKMKYLKSLVQGSFTIPRKMPANPVNASHGVPKSLHCLCLKLAKEYTINAMARSHPPPPEFVSCLVDSTFHHLVLLTSNVLAAFIVVTSLLPLYLLNYLGHLIAKRISISYANFL
ncbi:galacturonosyltransferase 15 [Spatholobus suberectus]|nr:galacturonosyltransferase 15 [Spatholobus suberectus]